METKNEILENVLTDCKRDNLDTIEMILPLVIERIIYYADATSFTVNEAHNMAVRIYNVMKNIKNCR